MKKIMIDKIKMFLALSILLSLTVSGCNKENDTSENSEKNSESSAVIHEGENHKNEVTLAKEQILLMGIESSKMESQNINGYIKVNGEIMMNQDNESRVGSIIPGRVKKIYVKEGAFVRAGQTLALIENPDLINVQVDYINAKNEFEFAKQEYNRQQKLSGDNIGSKKNLAEVETNYKRALANYKTLEEKLTSYKISKSRFDNIYTDTVADLQRNYSITAPISGSIVSRMVTIGQYVEPSMDMFHIVNTSSVYVDLSIFEKDLPYIHIGQKVVIETGTNSNETYEGKISFINKVFDDKNRTVKVRVNIDNKKQTLLPFMFVSAKIYVTDGSVLAVPVSSVETEGDEKYIFIKTDESEKLENADNKEEKNKNEEAKIGIIFKKVSVNTGISDDKYIEIFPLEDLKLHNEVITKGTFYLKSELKKDELSGEE